MRLEHERELAQLYVKKTFLDAEQKKVPSQDEIRAYFQAHQADYARPATVRVEHVLFAVSPTAQKSEAGQRRAAEKALRKVLLDSKRDPYAFEDLARSRSDDVATRIRGGLLPPLEQAALEKRVGKAVAAELWEKTQPGTIFTKPVRTSQGFELLKLVQHNKGYAPTLDQLQTQITSVLRRQQRTKDYEQFVKSVEASAHVRIDAQAIRDFSTLSVKEH
jgi:parvulin-like peptidyl-prolyl isomerase